MLAQYIASVIKLPVHIIGFTGFGTDGRGLQNTMEYMQDITKDMVVHLIRNDRFMQENDGSVIRSELAANEELANTIRTITGQLIKESTHNIDPTDIKKVVNMPGYEIVEYYELEDKIRNKKDFDRILAQMCDDSHAMQSHGMGRMGIILNLNENSQLYANDDSVLRNRYGVPYEPFIHRQHEGKECCCVDVQKQLCMVYFGNVDRHRLLLSSMSFSSSISSRLTPLSHRAVAKLASEPP